MGEKFHGNPAPNPGIPAAGRAGTAGMAGPAGSPVPGIAWRRVKGRCFGMRLAVLPALLLALTVIAGCGRPTPRVPRGPEPYTDEEFRGRHGYMLTTVLERPGMIRRYLAELNSRNVEVELKRFEVIRARQAAFIWRRKARVTGNLEKFLRQQILIAEFRERRERELLERQVEFLLRMNDFNPPLTPNQLLGGDQ